MQRKIPLLVYPTGVSFSYYHVCSMGLAYSVYRGVEVSALILQNFKLDGQFVQPKRNFLDLRVGGKLLQGGQHLHETKQHIKGKGSAPCDSHCVNHCRIKSQLASD